LKSPDKAADLVHFTELVQDLYDERRYVDDVSPLKDLPAVLEAVDIPVQAVGGLSIDQALETVRMGASSLVIGAPLAIQADRFAAGDEFKNVLREVVRRLRKEIS